MDNGFSIEAMLDVFIYETTHNIEQLEKTIMTSEKENNFSETTINEIFRIMHTIKGSSAMMMYNNIAVLAHMVEDLFYCIREEKPDAIDYALLSDLVLEGADFIKLELDKVQDGESPNGDASDLIERLKSFLSAIKYGEQADVAEQAAEVASRLKSYEAVIYFDDGCEMENVRAYAIVLKLKESVEQLSYIPKEIVEDSNSEQIIREKGFKMTFSSEKSFSELHDLLMNTAFVRELVLQELEEEAWLAAMPTVTDTDKLTTMSTATDTDELTAMSTATDKDKLAADIASSAAASEATTSAYSKLSNASRDSVYTDIPENSSNGLDVPSAFDAQASSSTKATVNTQATASTKATANTQAAASNQAQEQLKQTKVEQLKSVQSESRSNHQSMISVDVGKLDKLMDLMGEMVIAEAMVTQNPELQNLQLNNFHKAARQLRKITSEMQDMIMSIRMVPLSATFHKMHRIVRDMGRKLGKEVELTLIGERTEVDKNIIEHISDPLMHLIRNAVDHGIEAEELRLAAGKPKVGQIVLEAKNAGSDVLVTIKDDGKGLDKQKILQKAKKNGLLSKPEHEMSDKEICNLILLPGFSTNDNVTEFSGRGVGMDVVTKNLEAVGGSVSIDSYEGSGTITTLKIPLTLAIIDGMNVRVGNAKYTLPTTSIMETFQAKEKDIINDLDGNEMIMVRGECYPILRIHELHAVKTDTTELTKGIMLMVEQDEKMCCLFADELLGQQQVVVKTLPNYIKNTKRIEGLAGCTLLGDGSISLILNISGLLNIKA